MSGLIRDSAFIGGAWRSYEARFAVTNPADGSELASVADCGLEETKAAIDSAHCAFGPWAALDASARARHLKAWHMAVVAQQEALAALLTAEQGKPLAEARAEIAYAAGFIEWFAEEARRAYGETIPQDRPGREYAVIMEPAGVVAAITPWNFPAAMITRKVAPALAAGCTAVVKPSELTPLTALALAALAEEAGLPAGVLNVICGVGATAIGDVLCEDPRVAKLSFTGSTAVGKLLAAQCAGTVKRLSLELGGNAPFIVFEDADLDAAVDGLMTAKFRNSGQTCVCADRILLAEPVHDAFVAKLARKMEGLVTGPGDAPGTTQGPLINAQAVRKVDRLIQGAVAEGAVCRMGGRAGPGTLYAPTILTNVRADMAVFQEETFGPVVAIHAFQTDDEAIAIANGSRAGLAAYVYTKDYARAWRPVRALETGMVAVNDV